jgi:hypothetical protein
LTDRLDCSIGTDPTYICVYVIVRKVKAEFGSSQIPQLGSLILLFGLIYIPVFPAQKV